MKNRTWEELKDKINFDRNMYMIQLYIGRYSNEHSKYINVLIQLNYIEPILVTYRENNYDKIEYGFYKKLREIPDDLSWSEARMLIEQNKDSKKRLICPFTLWELIKKKINDCETDTFNEHDLVKHKSSYSYNGLNTKTYYTIFYKLGYLEKLDKKGNYKIIEKIPENLSSATAKKILYDKIYQRQMKINKLKDSLKI